MRHLIALLVMVGCSDPAAGPGIEISPGPVATVTQGGLLQLAARVDGAPAGSVTYDLAIDDPVAALFDVHTITPTETGAIVSLVPSCAALNGATNGIVSMSVGATGLDIPRATLAIDIVADANGVCAGAPEHAITVANFQVADVPDSGRVLCTRATVQHGSAHDAARELVRVYGPTGATASSGHLLCGAEDVRLELWPPIDAPATETIAVETVGCATDGCDAPATACCDAHPERTIGLTSSPITVPIRSVAEVDDTVEGVTLACADLDRDGTPELVLAGNTRTTAEVGHAGRYTTQLGPNVTGLLGLAWQAGPLASDVVWTILGDLGGNVVHAELAGGMVSWATDPRLTFPVGAPPPDAMLPVPTTPNGAAKYLAWIDGNLLHASCISDGCTADQSINIGAGVGGLVPTGGFGLADYDGDGDEDFIVAYRNPTGTIAPNKPVYLYAFRMDWSQPPPSWDGVPHLVVTLDVPGYEVHIAAVPSATSCQLIYVLSRGGWSSVDELTPTTCGASPTFTARTVPVVNDVHSISTVDQRLIAATALGVFELRYIGGNSVWQLQDPLLEEHILSTGETLIDSPTSRYAEQFVPCFAGTPSAAFRIARGGFEWAELDARVQTFSAGASP